MRDTFDIHWGVKGEFAHAGKLGLQQEAGS